MGGGKVAVIILVTMVPLELAQLPEGETPDFRGIAVHVIQLSTWAEMPLALFAMLERTQLVGHNAKGDATHLRKDFNLTLKEPLCTMAYAKKLFGPRESWNPNSQWGLDPLTKHLLGKGLSKDVTLSDWEATPLTDQQLSYAGLDALATLLNFQMLTLIEERGADLLAPLKWLVPKDNGSSSRHMLKHRVGYPVTVLQLNDDDDDDDAAYSVASLGLSVEGGRSFGLLLQKGSKKLQNQLGEHATVGNLSYAAHVEGNDLACLLLACACPIHLGDDDDDDELCWPARTVKWAHQDRFRPNIILKEQEEGGQPSEEEGDDADDTSITRGICSVHAASWLHKSGGGKGYFKTHETKNKEKQALVENQMKADIMRQEPTSRNAREGGADVNVQEVEERVQGEGSGQAVSGIVGQAQNVRCATATPLEAAAPPPCPSAAPPRPRLGPSAPRPPPRPPLPPCSSTASAAPSATALSRFGSATAPLLTHFAGSCVAPASTRWVASQTTTTVWRPPTAPRRMT